MDAADSVTIGKILGAHGVHGAVRVRYFGESPDLLVQRRMVAVCMPSGEVRQIGLRWARAHSKGMLLQLEGSDNREDAQALSGALLQIPKAELPALEEGTYYWADLMGMEVVTREGDCIGRVESILETGSNDVYVVKGPAGEVLVPALAEVVLEVDVPGRRMRVDLPEGL